MKLTKLTRKEMAMVGFAVAKQDEVGDMWNLISQVGDRLNIDAIYGEGLETTVWRACGALLGYEHDEIPTLHDRITEVVGNIEDDIRPEIRSSVWSCLQLGDYGAAVEMLKGTNSDARHEQHIVADSIQTIIDQYQVEVLT